ncbi:MAG TPA: SDR family oxidoreductase [Lentisphaeria bacterium]|nr:SDR family oxidoreductase [Lentisphaeria bacterium]
MLSGKVCVITGGANGIGRCLAETFTARRASVAILDCDEASGQELLSRLGGNHLFMAGDAAVESDLSSFAERVLATYGGVDFLINNACRSRGGLLSRCSYDQFLEALKVGVAAPYYLSLLFRPHFRPGASIVNISSTRAFQSQRNTESYSAAKGGIASLTHALAMSLAGVARVNCIAPGWIDTRDYHPASAKPTTTAAADHHQHTVGRIGRPEDIAGLVMYLCSQEASFIDGECIVIDGGMSRQMVYHGDEGWSFTPPA